MYLSGTVFWAPVNLDHISRSAIKQLRLKLGRCEKRAKLEMEDRHTLRSGSRDLTSLRNARSDSCFSGTC